MGRKAADYTGQKFGQLTALRSTGTKHHRGFLWEWLCDCGNVHVALPSHVVSGSTQSCGCLRDTSKVIKAGDRIGRLVVVEKTAAKQGATYLWRVICDCGNEVALSVSALRGSQKSCGCLKRETKTRLRHGHGAEDSEGRVTHRTWVQMRARCRGRNPMGAKHYKSRGIAVCKEWAESYEAFLADMGLRPPGTTIERIDNNRGYEPGNCRWATQAEQVKNTRRTIRVRVDGVEMCLKDACAVRGVPYDRIISRIRLGADPQEALDRPSPYRPYRRTKI